MKDFTIQLQANTPYDINFIGSSYHVQEASSPLKLSFNNGESIIRERTQGAKINPYRSVRLESVEAQMVTVVLGDGLVLDGRTELSDQKVSVIVDVSSGLFEHDDLLVGAVPVSVVPSNSVRKSVLIGVPSDSDFNIRIGSSNISASRGVVVEAGSTIEVNTNGQVFAIAPEGDVLISITEQGDF